jgi:uncharacterized protein with NAD-binding domain and iron-sulfur cluster
MEKIAILGGGIGALTAAFELTKVPDWQSQYDITVYQQGWRLGGKGASARNPDANWRIEEHGPHVWFGFYFNAFRVIEDAYAYCRQNGLLPEGAFTGWQQAFQPKDDSTILDYAGGKWDAWTITMPDTGGSPLEPQQSHWWAQLVRGLTMLVDRLEIATRERPELKARLALPSSLLLLRVHAAASMAAGLPATSHREKESLLHVALRLAEDVAPRIEGRLPWLRARLRDASLWLIQRVVQRFLASFQKAAAPLIERDPEIRHLGQLLDLSAALLRGLLADGVLEKGFDAIETIDFSHWLEKYGCLNSWSPLIRAIYDSGAHYEGGRSNPGADPNIRPAAANLAAGSAVHAMLRLFGGYAGHFSYRMQAGMGECVMTPIYLALRHKGVKFQFFHRVTAIHVAGTEVTSVDINVQAALSPAVSSYQPLLPPFRGLLCWPPAPLWDQLEHGDRLRGTGLDLESAWCPFRVGTVRLERGVDFHKVILGVPIATLPTVCGELTTEPRWRAMLSGLKTVQTQFLQAWMTATTETLAGMPGMPTAEGFREPFDTWLDMSQLLPHEDWPADVKSVHYFVGALEDSVSPPPGMASEFPQEQRDAVYQGALAFFRSGVTALWPNFDWTKVHAPDTAQGEQRMRSQYWRANVDPSDRYTLSTTGSKYFRMRSDDSGFRNLFLAGDWTLNGLNAGSVEAAVMSGMQACQGISGYPREILGGYAEMSRK